MSEYIPKELVEKAKSLTLLEYLNTYFPEEVVKKVMEHIQQKHMIV